MLRRRLNRIWAITAILTLILLVVFQVNAKVCEVIYRDGIFQIFRIIYDYTLGFNPIPNFYLVLPSLLIVLFFILRSRQIWVTRLFDVLKLLSFLFFTFYLTWGFNYFNRSLEEQLSWKLDNPDIEYLETEISKVSKELNNLRPSVESANLIKFSDLQNLLRPALENQLATFGFKTLGRVRARKIIPGFLLVWRTSGIYLPQTFEGHIDGGLYNLQWPFTAAHEMAHGYGITSEADCNFFAYLTCISMDDANIKYSGLLAYWRYLASELRQRDKESYNNHRTTLSDLVEGDLKEIRNHIDRFPQIMPAYRDKVYNQYLKSHGINDGIKNYNRMVLLIKAHQEAQLLK